VLKNNGFHNRHSPTSRAIPSLALDFLVQPLDNRITFTRTTTATFTGSNGLIQSAAINAPRFDYNPTTLAPLGLLIEGQRTNLLLRSEEFNNAYWFPVEVTIAANSTASPSGAVNADTIIPTATLTGIHRLQLNPGIGAGAHSVSLYAKASGYSWLKLRLGSLYANFNISTGVAGVVGAGVTSTITNVGNGWYRCTITGTTLSGDTLFISPMTTNNAALDPVAYAGDGVSGVFFWGAQLEAGAFATSYIPTAASQVTRTADNASMTGTNFSSWYNQTEGTVVCETSSASSITTGRDTLFTFESTVSGTKWLAGRGISGGASNQVYGGVFDNSVTQAFMVGATLLNTNGYKLAMAVKTNNFALTVNSGAVATDISGTLPSVISSLIIGAEGGSYANGAIKRITYYPSRLSNTQLQELTS
jgi:hypothetical protein